MVGVIKSAIKEAMLDGIIPNDHEAAREFMIGKDVRWDWSRYDNHLTDTLTVTGR